MVVRSLAWTRRLAILSDAPRGISPKWASAQYTRSVSFVFVFVSPTDRPAGGDAGARGRRRGRRRDGGRLWYPSGGHASFDRSLRMGARDAAADAPPHRRGPFPATSPG